MAADDKVVTGLTHAQDDPESVLICYLLGVETLSVPGAPSIAELHAEYVQRGGRFFACPVCVKTHGLENAEWTDGAEVKGAPSLYEFTQGGALVFNY
jgi:predicted peroxiredoxin